MFSHSSVQFNFNCMAHFHKEILFQWLLHTCKRQEKDKTMNNHCLPWPSCPRTAPALDSPSVSMRKLNNLHVQKTKRTSRRTKWDGDPSPRDGHAVDVTRTVQFNSQVRKSSGPGGFQGVRGQQDHGVAHPCRLSPETGELELRGLVVLEVSRLAIMQLAKSADADRERETEEGDKGKTTPQICQWQHLLRGEEKLGNPALNNNYCFWTNGCDDWITNCMLSHRGRF